MAEFFIRYTHPLARSGHSGRAYQNCPFPEAVLVELEQGICIWVIKIRNLEHLIAIVRQAAPYRVSICPPIHNARIYPEIPSLLIHND